MRQPVNNERFVRRTLCTLAKGQGTCRSDTDSHSGAKNLSRTRVRQAGHRERTMPWALPTAETRSGTLPTTRSPRYRRPTESTATLCTRREAGRLLAVVRWARRQGIWVDICSWVEKTWGTCCCLGAGEWQIATPWNGRSTQLRHPSVYQRCAPHPRNTGGQRSGLYRTRQAEHPQRTKADETSHTRRGASDLPATSARGELQSTCHGFWLLTCDNKSDCSRRVLSASERIGLLTWL